MRQLRKADEANGTFSNTKQQALSIEDGDWNDGNYGSKVKAYISEKNVLRNMDLLFIVVRCPISSMHRNRGTTCRDSNGRYPRAESCGEN